MSFKDKIVMEFHTPKRNGWYYRYLGSAHSPNM